MKVRIIGKYGHVSDFDTIKEANESEGTEWRERANEISHPDGNWLEASYYIGEAFGQFDVPFAQTLEKIL